MGIFDEVAKRYRRGAAKLDKAKKTPAGKAIAAVGEAATGAEESAEAPRMGSYSKYPAPKAAPVKPMPVRK